jgi:hypothetical protein
MPLYDKLNMFAELIVITTRFTTDLTFMYYFRKLHENYLLYQWRMNGIG